jgi:hypothetical protein
MRLSALIPPPDAPVRAYGDWKRFVGVNGFPPPEDYRMMIREYGAGSFGDWLYLIEPFHHTWTFKQMVETECEDLRRARQHGGNGAAAWPIWPELGGLLPWATTSTGDHICWKTQGRQDSWTTVVWSRDASTVEYPVGAVDFVLGVAQRNLGDSRFDDATTNPFGSAAFTPPDD